MSTLPSPYSFDVICFRQN